MPTTMTWSNSRPLVAWAVASVSGASSRRSSASRDRVRSMADTKVARSRYGAAQPSIAVAISAARASSMSRVGGPGPSAMSSGRADAGVSPPRPAEDLVDDGDSSSRSIRGARNGRPSRRATTTAGSSSRFVRARTARVVPSAGHDRMARSRRTVSSGGVRREDQPALGRRPCPDPLGEPLPVVLDEPDGPFDDRPRAAVVDLEVDPRRPGQRALEPQDPAHIGQPPAIDRLVVVADEEDPVGRGGEEEGEPELGAVDILDLVHQELPATTAPSGEEGRVGLERRDRAEDQVVEVEPAGRGHGVLVGDERTGKRTRVGVGCDLPGARRAPP